MKLAHNFPRRTSRAAFTLVELLVVIAIIIVLASLLLAAVFKALDLANEAATRTEDTQLSAAIESFKTKYQAGYPPSRLVLCKQRTNYFDSNTGLFKSQLHQDSLEYLGRVWPRLDWTTPQPQGGPYTWQGIDWDNSGVAAFTVRDASNNAVPAGEIALEGEQCLVFFLGGIPGSGTVNGFSTSASNPAFIGGDRVPPFFDGFKSNRLVSLSQWVIRQGGSPLGYNDFYIYLDAYGKTPYAYFSSYKTMNGYNRYFPFYGNSDCQTLGVWPYAQSGVYPAAQPQSLPPPIYLNAQTYQLISAGKNQRFGSGTVIAQIQQPQGNWIGGPTWNPSSATAIYPLGSDGYDDIANFYDRLLGVPTQ